MEIIKEQAVWGPQEYICMCGTILKISESDIKRTWWTFKPFVKCPKCDEILTMSIPTIILQKIEAKQRAIKKQNKIDVKELKQRTKMQKKQAKEIKKEEIYDCNCYDC